MQFEITRSGEVAIVSVEGNLNALDLLFMFQSTTYKKVIAQYSKVLIDYSDINGSMLTAEDAIGITLLGKLDLDKRQYIHIAVAVNDNERAVMEKVTSDIFSNSEVKVTIVNTRRQAMIALNNTG